MTKATRAGMPTTRKTAAQRFAPQSSPPPVPNGSNGMAEPNEVVDSASSEEQSRERLSQTVEPLSIRTAPSRFAKTSTRSQLMASRSDSESTNIQFGEALQLGAGVNDVISVIAKLDSLGLAKFDIPLPKCVVLGEQSTGKSSVIEAISGIKTPRSTDTCTRCPLFIKMNPGEPDCGWTANVYLQINYKSEMKGRGQRKTPSWARYPTPYQVAFATTKDPEELENVIARAQLALLNPNQDPKDFIPSHLRSEHLDVPLVDMNRREQEFSPNHVCIEITAPGMPALSFYDLPGIIGQTEDASTMFLVNFVRELVSFYVKDHDSLILVTCSLANDMANSSAANIARKFGATDRCIGVLTKPDLPGGSNEATIRRVLDGKAYHLGHGYFVVKNLGQDDIDRGLKNSDARQQEQQFFSDSHPWSTASFLPYQQRFGTMNLQSYLSQQLAAQSLKALPQINDKISRCLYAVNLELAQIPEPPSQNAVHIIFDKILHFSEEVRKELEGDFEHKTWNNRWRRLRKLFADGLDDLKPLLRLAGSLDKGIYNNTINGKSVDQSIVIIDTEDEEEFATPKKRKFDRVTSNVSTPTPASRMANGSTPGAATEATSTPRKERPKINPYRTVFNLDDLAKDISENSITRIPGRVDLKVVDHMILRTLDHWETPLDEFFREFQAEFQDLILTIYSRHFKQWEDSEVFGEGVVLLQEILTNNFQEQRESMAAESLIDERDGPHILNDDIYQFFVQDILKKYRAKRTASRKKIYEREYEALNEKSLPEREHKHALYEQEPYAKEIEAAAQVTAYYSMASRRFLESVCMRIESKFFKLLKTKLREEMVSHMGIHDPGDGHEKAMKLLEQPPEVRAKREDLVNKKTALLEGMQLLEDLRRKHGVRTSNLASRAYDTNMDVDMDRDSEHNGFDEYDGASTIKVAAPPTMEDPFNPRRH